MYTVHTYSHILGESMRIRTWFMTHSHVYRDSRVCVTQLTHILYIGILAIKVNYRAYGRETWRIHTCGVTHVYAWHDWFRELYIGFPAIMSSCRARGRETWLIHMCNVTHLYVWHDSLIYCTWIFLQSRRTLALSDARQDAFTRVVWRTWKRDMADVIHCT
jgi:hypothetical protein